MAPSTVRFQGLFFGTFRLLLDSCSVESDWHREVTKHMVKADLLHQRGMCCFNVYLKNRASTVVSYHTQLQAVTKHSQGITRASNLKPC